MDAKDKVIVQVLQRNARTSIRDIAKETGIRPSTVHKRLKQLVENKIIEKFTVKLNNQAINQHFIVFVLVKTKPGKLIDNKLLRQSCIKEVFGITGDFDLLIKMKFADIDEFNTFLLHFRKHEAIATTNTMISTVHLKEEL